MKILGVSALNHDASLALIEDGEILWAAQSERYSKVKQDGYLNQAIVDEALSYGQPDLIAYYERPLVKKLRQAKAGQWHEVFTQMPVKHIRSFGLTAPIKYFSHHKSHAAAGYYTSTFKDACVIVIDAIGEFETLTIWEGKGANLKKVHSKNYPYSIGLFYSAFTKLLGLKPNEEEYILMGMAAYGNPMPFLNTVKRYATQNLHKGISGWPELLEQEKYDLAASVQLVYENMLKELLLFSKTVTNTNNLVLVGGCALNCVANRLLGDYYDNIWIMPNPGDAGSSIGAAALAGRSPVNFRSAYLGHNIPGNYPVDDMVNELLTKQIVGVASGRAEFGPRALGNRSLLADPRGSKIKEIINDIKQREQFRPFAPVILEELVDSYFIMPSGWSSSRYMQVVGHCRNPNIFPAVVHRDGSSRVQTCPKDGSGIRRVLEKWYALTGCPMLLNTSLNIKGQPIVNTEQDAIDWQNQYGVKVAIRS